MNEERKAQLTAILGQLETLEGVKLVESDDFDSTAVNVFITLEATSHVGRDLRPMVFKSGIRNVKANVTRICRESDIGLVHLDWPHMQYKSVFGEKYKCGYNHNYLKVSLYI